MEKNQYYLTKRISETGGCLIFSGHDGHHDRPLTMIQFQSPDSGDCAEVRSFRELQRVKHSSSLPIIEIISEDGVHLVVTPQFNGLDVATWFETHGETNPETALRFAMEILEWTTEWHRTNGTWPWLKPEHVWVTETESGELDLKIGTVISPVPEKASLDSIRDVLGLLLDEDGCWGQFANGVFATFFSRTSEGGPTTIEAAMNSLDSGAKPGTKPGNRSALFGRLRLLWSHREDSKKGRDAEIDPSEAALSR